MRFTKLAVFSSVLAALSAPVAAQGIPTQGLTFAGNLLETVLGGIIRGVSANPAVWMKVILGIAVFVFLYSVLGFLKRGNEPFFARNSLIVLSIVLSIGIIAPIPDEFVVGLFGGFGFLGTLFFIAPIIGLMYLTHKMTHDGTRAEYLSAMLLWLVALGYIGGVGSQVKVTGMDMAQGISALIAVFYIFGYLIRAFGIASAAGREAVEYAAAGGNATPAQIQAQRQAAATAKAARVAPSAHDLAAVRNDVNRAIGELPNIQTQRGNVVPALTALQTNPADPPLRSAAIITLTNLRRRLVILENYLARIQNNKQVRNYLELLSSPSPPAGGKLARAWGTTRNFFRSFITPLAQPTIQVLINQVASDVKWCDDSLRIVPTLQATDVNKIADMHSRLDSMLVWYGSNAPPQQGEAQIILERVLQDLQ